MVFNSKHYRRRSERESWGGLFLCSMPEAESERWPNVILVGKCTWTMPESDVVSEVRTQTCGGSGELEIVTGVCYDLFFLFSFFFFFTSTLSVSLPHSFTLAPSLSLSLFYGNSHQSTLRHLPPAYLLFYGGGGVFFLFFFFGVPSASLINYFELMLFLSS